MAARARQGEARLHALRIDRLDAATRARHSGLAVGIGQYGIEGGLEVVIAMADDEPDNELDQAVLDALKESGGLHLCGSCRSTFVSASNMNAWVKAYEMVAERRTAGGSIRFKDEDIAEAIFHRLDLTPEECPACYPQGEALDQL